jgi:hypothetical protein
MFECALPAKVRERDHWITRIVTAGFFLALIASVHLLVADFVQGTKILASFLPLTSFVASGERW